MTKLTEKERISFEKIVEQDICAIESRMVSQIKDFWVKAREEVLKTKGWDKLIMEKEELVETNKKNQERIHQIESEMNSDELRVEQVVELGGNPNEYGAYKGANFHSLPINSQFEYEIVEFIRNNINLNVPAKFLLDLGRSVQRALAMSGTFEEARDSYDEFYSLDFRKYGVDIPPRLKEVKNDLERLNYAQQTLSMPIEKQGDAKAIEDKNEEKKKVDYVR